MVDHYTDNLQYMSDGLAARQTEHDHLLTKDPRRLGWRCKVLGCRFFKPAAEFDGLGLAERVDDEVPGGGSRGLAA